MIRIGIILLTSGIVLSLLTSFGLDKDTPYLSFFQAAGFLLGVVGLFLMERNRVQKRAEQRKQKRMQK
ncbi:hypothetical protein [Bacillus testis]|uniref:hypothetical protein n=1 Tax=Bacillus testis TaxID=1622072 RepID=UPI00067F4742|nr:hypothetical protein [Bacillus testis]